MATQNNKQLLHRKEFQFMTPAQIATAAGAFIVKDPKGDRRTALYVAGTATQYLYDVRQDSWQQLPSFALAGTFGAGACGTWAQWGMELRAASGGTTGSVNLTSSIAGDNIVGKQIWFQSAGSNSNARATIVSASIVPNGTSSLFFSPVLPTAVAPNSTFKMDTATYYVLNAYTSLAAGVFKAYDVLTGNVLTLATSGLPASWGTDGRIVATPSYMGVYQSGSASSGSFTVVQDTSKAWVTNQWANFQIRLISGSGAGQARTITSNTSNTITVSGSFATSSAVGTTYAIEGNDEYLYLAGNGAVTMYRYSTLTNTWATLSPVAARAAAPGAGMSLNWLGRSYDSTWISASIQQDGMYLYSFRGAGTTTLHRYSIPGNTWATIPYLRESETFTTGTSYDFENGDVFIQKDATGRFFKYSAPGNQLIPIATDLYAQSTAVVGDKVFSVTYDDDGGDAINWIYYLGNTTNILRRVMIY